MHFEQPDNSPDALTHYCISAIYQSEGHVVLL